MNFSRDNSFFNIANADETPFTLWWYLAIADCIKQALLACPAMAVTPHRNTSSLDMHYDKVIKI